MRCSDDIAQISIHLGHVLRKSNGVPEIIGRDKLWVLPLNVLATLRQALELAEVWVVHQRLNGRFSINLLLSIFGTCDRIFIGIQTSNVLLNYIRDPSLKLKRPISALGGETKGSMVCIPSGERANRALLVFDGLDVASDFRSHDPAKLGDLGIEFIVVFEAIVDSICDSILNQFLTIKCRLSKENDLWVFSVKGS